MNQNVWTVALAAAIFAAIALWAAPGFPATAPDRATSDRELRRLADLDDSLQSELRAHEQHLSAICDYPIVYRRLDELQTAAVDAVARLGMLWRAGRLRNGGVALAEVLFNDLASLIDAAGADMAGIERLARLHQELREGSAAARARLQHVIDSEPAVPACLAEMLDHPGNESPVTARSEPSRRTRR